MYALACCRLAETLGPLWHTFRDPLCSARGTFSGLARRKERGNLGQLPEKRLQLEVRW